MVAEIRAVKKFGMGYSGDPLYPYPKSSYHREYMDGLVQATGVMFAEMKPEAVQEGRGYYGSLQIIGDTAYNPEGNTKIMLYLEGVSGGSQQNHRQVNSSFINRWLNEDPENNLAMDIVWTGFGAPASRKYPWLTAQYYGVGGGGIVDRVRRASEVARVLLYAMSIGDVVVIGQSYGTGAMSALLSNYSPHALDAIKASPDLHRFKGAILNGLTTGGRGDGTFLSAYSTIQENTNLLSDVAQLAPVVWFFGNKDPYTPLYVVERYARSLRPDQIAGKGQYAVSSGDADHGLFSDPVRSPHVTRMIVQMMNEMPLTMLGSDEILIPGPPMKR